ncbi:MAG TPA: carboxypeptidase-like regulatory domain-containing protein [Thermoanaerobaculia bacterium]
MIAMLLVVAALSGRVTTDGAPLAGATVMAVGDALPQPRTTITDANGRWWMPALPPGEYDVIFSMTGHQTLTRRARVRFGEPTRSDADLARSEEGEAVTMTAAPRSLLERPRSVFTIDAETLEQLPNTRVRTLSLDALREESIPISGFHRHHFVVTPTWSGGNEFTGSARLTHESAGARNTATTFEAQTGGRIIEDRLWYFGTGLVSDHVRGGLLKVTASPTERDAVIVRGYVSDLAQDDLAVRWSHFGTRATFSAAGSTNDFHALTGYALLRGHELAGGYVDDAFFLSDRYVVGSRFIIDAGIRYEEDDWSPRAGVVYDLLGNGEHRLAANASDDELALTYGQRLGASGYARATALRRDTHDDALVIDGIYHWLLFTFGGLARFGDGTRGAAWVQIDPPLLDHDVNVTLLERYQAGFAATDLALNYRFARMTVTPFIKLEAANVFGRRGEERVYRVGIGARL